MSTNWNVSSRSLHPFFLIFLFACPLQLCLCFMVLSIYTLHKRWYHPGALFHSSNLTLFYILSRSFWKMLAFDFLLGISKIFLCSMSTVWVNFGFPLDTLQRLMLFVRMLIYLKSKRNILIILWPISMQRLGKCISATMNTQATIW
jgi:hypothetical protein